MGCRVGEPERRLENGGCNYGRMGGTINKRLTLDGESRSRSKTQTTISRLSKDHRGNGPRMQEQRDNRR